MKAVILFLLIALLAVSQGKKYLAHIYLPSNSSLAIKDNWMVVFYPNTSVELREAHMQKLSSSLDTTFESIGNTWNIYNDFLGYHGVFKPQTLRAIRSDPNVKHVEQDSIVSIDACVSQNNAVWNLRRLSAVTRFANTQNGPFGYDNAAGSGITVYIIDTGILTTHVDFGGRATVGANFVTGENSQDCNGHGTHVAGTAAGSTYGAAKSASLVAVKVLGCSGSGTTAGVNSGINWVGTQSAPRKVVNMSLGGGYSATQNNAINALANGGAFVAVAAGNSNVDLANSSPASAACNGPTWAVGATTISASTYDTRATFSNYGSCLTVFAPGQNILSDWIGSNTATYTASGTSMASPLVAGAAALLWSQTPSSSANALRTSLSGQVYTGIVSSVPNGTPNRFLHLTNCQL